MARARLPGGERPRERLYWNGATALADVELLALQLGSGTRGRTAVDVARALLAAFGSLAEVAAREPSELAHVRGVGPAKAARLAAAFELTRRLRGRQPGERLRLASPAEVYAAYAPLMEDLRHEVFRVALLDAQNRLLRDRVVSGSAAPPVHPREVFAGDRGVGRPVILPYNHPSGDPTPSRRTSTPPPAGGMRPTPDLRIHDHVIIGQGRLLASPSRVV
jgi:DNA repair protein RadC